MTRMRYRYRLCGVLAVALAVCSGSAAAAETEAEVRFDPRTGAIAGRLPYAANFSLAATLPDGAQATLSYWPAGPQKRGRRATPPTKADSELCTKAAETNADFVVRRMGVASGSAEDGSRKYVFSVEPLRVNVSYCFKLEYEHPVKVNDLTGRVGHAVVRALGALLSDLEAGKIAERASLQGCDRIALKKAQDSGAVTACAVAHEVVAQDPGLAGLTVRLAGEDEKLAFVDALTRLLEENSRLRERFGDAMRSAQRWTRQSSQFPNARAAVVKATAGHGGELTDKVRELPTAPNARCEATIDAVRGAAKCEAPGQESLCREISALRSACVEAWTAQGEIDAFRASEGFKAMVDELKQVSVVSVPAKVLELGPPTFDEWINFHASLDVGAVGVPFRADSWGIAQYIGVNFYFTAIDRNERLVWGRRGYEAYGGREFLKRFSLTLGVTTTGATLRKEDGVSGALGNQFALFGAGLRLFGGVRLSAGGLLYKQSSQNPARVGTSYKLAPFIGLAFDIDLFRWIRKGLGDIR